MRSIAANVSCHPPPLLPSLALRISELFFCFLVLMRAVGFVPMFRVSCWLQLLTLGRHFRSQLAVLAACAGLVLVVVYQRHGAPVILEDRTAALNQVHAVCTLTPRCLLDLYCYAASLPW